MRIWIQHSISASLNRQTDRQTYKQADRQQLRFNNIDILNSSIIPLRTPLVVPILKPSLFMFIRKRTVSFEEAPLSTYNSDDNYFSDVVSSSLYSLHRSSGSKKW